MAVPSAHAIVLYGTRGEKPIALAHYIVTVRADRSLELPREAQQLLIPGQRVEIHL